MHYRFSSSPNDVGNHKRKATSPFVMQVTAPLDVKLEPDLEIIFRKMGLV